MFYTYFSAIISAVLLLYGAAYLVFFTRVYSWRAGVILLPVLAAFEALAFSAVRYYPALHGDFRQYLWKEHFLLFVLPFSFAVELLGGIGPALLRKCALSYAREGNTLRLYLPGGTVALQPAELLQVHYLVGPVFSMRGRSPFLYRVKTTRGTFWFDDNLEKNYWDATERVSFWSLREGVEQLRRNARLQYGNAKASDYFREYFRR